MHRLHLSGEFLKEMDERGVSHDTLRTWAEQDEQAIGEWRLGCLYLEQRCAVPGRPESVEFFTVAAQRAIICAEDWFKAVQLFDWYTLRTGPIPPYQLPPLQFAIAYALVKMESCARSRPVCRRLAAALCEGGDGNVEKGFRAAVAEHERRLLRSKINLHCPTICQWLTLLSTRLQILVSGDGATRREFLSNVHATFDAALTSAKRWAQAIVHWSPCVRGPSPWSLASGLLCVGLASWRVLPAEVVGHGGSDIQRWLDIFRDVPGVRKPELQPCPPSLQLYMLQVVAWSSGRRPTTLRSDSTAAMQSFMLAHLHGAWAAGRASAGPAVAVGLP